jgi:hypothetical protein
MEDKNQVVMVQVDVRNAPDLSYVDCFISHMGWEETIKNKHWQSCHRYSFSFKEVDSEKNHDPEKGHRYSSSVR